MMSQMQEIILVTPYFSLSLQEIVIGTGLAIVGLIILAIIISNARARQFRRMAVRTDRQNQELNQYIQTLAQSQSQLVGRIQAMAEQQGKVTGELTRHLTEKMDSTSHRVSSILNETREKTQENISNLHERLAVIDAAQKTMTDVSSEIISLQSIFTNKQLRGQFGQGRMELIIEDGLPQGSFAFQPTLSTGSRPDCIIDMPNEAPGLVVDAKFPLEAWTKLQEAQTEADQKQASQQLKQDFLTHIKDISTKYLIKGETHDLALMFVPSESIFADIHAHFEEIVQKALKARILMVSPSLLMLAVQLIQSLLRDVRMREQAHIIQTEVVLLLEDVQRLQDRVINLQKHHAQSMKDIDQILTSTDKITKRGMRVEAMEIEDIKPSVSEKATQAETDEGDADKNFMLAGE